MGFAELVAAIRARSAADEERAECIHDLSCSELAYDGTCDCGWPARVRAEVAGKRQLLDQVLGWEHYEVDDPWYSCSAAPNAPSEHRAHGCTCGRDERVLAVLQLLATPYQETK